MADLKRWVSDELHGLLGISEGTLVDYVIALAKRSKDEVRDVCPNSRTGVSECMHRSLLTRERGEIGR